MLLNCLFGCNNIYNSQGQATAHIDIDSYCAGARTINCALDQNYIEKSVLGGKTSLDSFIKIHCPEELSFTCVDENNYQFKLDFENLTDYKNKVSAVIGRPINIVFGAPDNIFAKGFRLKEDFSNQDLMLWFYESIYEEGLIEYGTDLWKFGDTTINYNESSYTSSGIVDIIDLNYIPIDKICIDTNKFDESFKRSVSFQISNQSLDLLAETIDNYMTSLVPLDSNFNWSDTTDGKVFTVNFDAANEQELQSKTNIVLDNQFNFITYSKQNKTFFNSTKILTEELNFLCFPSNREGKTFVEYTFTFDDNDSTKTVFTSNNGRLVDMSKTIENNAFNLSQDVDLLNVSITNVDEYKVSHVKIDMTETSPANFTRNIAIIFDGNNGPKGAELAKHFIDSRNIQYLSSYTDNNSCIVSIGSSIEEINLALGELFTKENALTISVSNNFSLHNYADLKDNIDMSEFLLGIGYSGQVEYNVHLLDKIISVEKLDSSGQAMQISNDGNNFNLLIPSPGIAVVSASSEKLNVFYAVVLIILSLVGISGIAFLIYYLVYRFRKKENFTITDKRCLNCNEPIYESMNFCIKCGRAVDDEFDGKVQKDNCPNCNAQTYEGMNFCIKCGKLLHENEKSGND